MRGTQLAWNEGIQSTRREEIIDHAVVGTPNGPEYWELVRTRYANGSGIVGYAIKRYGGSVPWSLFERLVYADSRTAYARWYESIGDIKESR